MGLANIANSIAGPLALVIGGRVLDYVTVNSGLDAGPRAATLTGVVFLAGAALMLTMVRPRYCGTSPVGLLGSFHASQYLTAGSRRPSKTRRYRPL